ncbi:hypothetical protein LEP1GSC083_4617 [Leptospira interrogans serovar Pyrogenes str. L0374]|uniref:Uncharacterized protein n=1 Tax=Leptospira interrogans serovar Pyrogenes str. L0374 TaxID=1049928 RepID=M6K3J5_LEPIR|nr:hypothetical protein LEP1GSC083_4617 [Leptospira interrogans serovar Pyrogenes str. L0374]EMN71086.1 hypothetical protein LEP1GSC100_0601 [Leptospira interrogans serovar Bataviae str. UI 08561]
MNTTSRFYFLESFTPDLQNIRIQKQIESDWMEQSNIIGNK